MNKKIDMCDVLCQLESIVAVFDIVNGQFTEEVSATERCDETDKDVMIKQFLKSKVFTDTSSIKVRKLIVNTFIREIIYYPDKLIITYNFSDAIDTINLTPENAKEIERQSKSAFSLDIGSSICQYSSPTKTKGVQKHSFCFCSYSVCGI